MPTIDHGDMIDIRDLAELATECDDILAEEEPDEDEAQEARETLEKLASFCKELGYWDVDPTVAESVSDQLQSIGDNEPTLIAESYFVDYCEELVKDIGDLPTNLPGYLENNINWQGVADDLKVDYNSVTLDGTDYYTRAY